MNLKNNIMKVFNNFKITIRHLAQIQINVYSNYVVGKIKQ